MVSSLACSQLNSSFHGGSEEFGGKSKAPRAVAHLSLLCHHSEPNHSEVMIERTCNANTRAFHDGKARGIDGRELVEVSATKVFPRLLQIAQLAGKDFYDGEIIRDCFHVRATSRLALRSRNVNVSITTGTEV